MKILNSAVSEEVLEHIGAASDLLENQLDSLDPHLESSLSSKFRIRLALRSLREASDEVRRLST